LLAVPDARPGLAAEDIDWLAVELRTALAAEGRDVQPRLMRGGHAGGLLALQRCWTVFASGRAQAALIGGVDCWIDADTIDWLEGEERLFTPSNPHGFIPGEAAAFCLVTAPPADAAHARGAVPINGIATATEDVPRGGEQPNLGHGLTTAIGDALRRLPPTQRVTDILCDFNGEMERADEYSFVCVRLGERFVDATMTRTPADCWGDVGAATGPLLLALAYEGTRQNWLNGEHILVWCSADTRHRAAALLGTPVI
jgi:3-oxoacyl-[acyl-carrier-protein] synthase-1